MEKGIEAADGIARSMAVLDLEQSIVTADDKEKRKTDAEIALTQCQRMIHTRRAKIQDKIAADKAEAEAAAAAARTAAMTAATTVAPAKRGPKLETLSLPDFTGGQLKDYARFRRDWQNVVGESMSDEIQLIYI